MAETFSILEPPYSLEDIFRFGKIRDYKSLDAISIAFHILNLEKEIKKNCIDEIHINVSNTKWKEGIEEDLIDLISYTLFEYVQFKFLPSKFKFKVTHPLKKISKFEAVCLFSGGIDSFSGILNAFKQYNNLTGIFSAHSDQKKIIKIVNDIYLKYLEPLGIKLHKIKAPSMGKGHYSQTRGFLYMLSAAAFMNFVEANKLIVCECGPTMYQPQFGPADTVTLTSNPVVIDIARKVIDKIFNRQMRIITPFEDLTKAEIMSISIDKDALCKTHSCITQRFGDHCGTCYGCIIRRLAGIAANIDDSNYKKNPLLDDNANAENLQPLLSFSQDVLINFENMEYFQRRNIDTYQKEDLFKRFALDNFAAIHKLISEGNKVTKLLEILYFDTINIIGKDILDERLEALRKGDFKPDFN